MARKDQAVASAPRKNHHAPGAKAGKKPRAQRVPRQLYEAELYRLQAELVKAQEWVRAEQARIVVIFEGRDAAGKGSTIKRVTQYLNPRIARIAALPAPTEREQAQWYFQRYIEHLPASGQIVLFDRSWYNRAGVEHVMGFCTKEEYARFLHQCPIFERLLVEDGILLRKYWFSVSDAEQQERFRSRLEDPMRRWKLSSMDLESVTRWEDYSRAKDEMMLHTDIPEAPWYVVESDDKRRARINMIAHLLSTLPYHDVQRAPLTLPAGRLPRATCGCRARCRPTCRTTRRPSETTGVSEPAVTEPDGTGPAQPAARPGVAASIWALEHAQDFVTLAVGVVLILLAATLAVYGVVGFVEDVQKHSITIAATNLLDRVLLVLILVEIVHTVVLSLRAHRLAAQPFIVVGLVAVIRRILFLLSNQNNIPTTELALLIGMVVAFVAAYLAVSYFEKPGLDEEGPPPRGRGKKNATGRVESLGG